MENYVGQPINRRGVFLVSCALRTLGFSLLTRLQTDVLKMFPWVWVKGCPGKGRHAACIHTIKSIRSEGPISCRNGFLSKVSLNSTHWLARSQWKILRNKGRRRLPQTSAPSGMTAELLWGTVVLFDSGIQLNPCPRHVFPSLRLMMLKFMEFFFRVRY